MYISDANQLIHTYFIKMNAIHVLTCITLLLHDTIAYALISIWLKHFILHGQ